MSVVNAIPLLAAAGGDYQISRSVRLRSSASAYFNRTLTTPTNNLKWTWSKWVKRGALGVTQQIFGTGTLGTGADQAGIQFATDNTLYFYQTQTSTGSYDFVKQTTQVFRDPSAYYHITVTYDSTDATASNRIKIWVNGAQVTSFATSTNPTLNMASRINAARSHDLGRYGSGINYFDGYLTEVNFIDGQALTPSSFGENDAVTGVWKPKKYAGTYGTNGFYLNFSDNSAATAAAIGKDSSGNGNNWTPNNISVTAGVTYDSMLDVPTMWADGGNGRGNYPVWNPLEPNAALGGGLADANLIGYPANTASTGQLKATINFPTSGKFYFEVTPTVITSATTIVGILKTSIAVGATPSSAGDMYAYQSDGNKWNGSATASYGATYTTNDVIGVAFDIDAGTLTFYKNGTTQSQAYSGIAGEYVAAVRDGATGGIVRYAANFGQRPFAYTPPTGFKALNTQNLPDATIKKGNQYFDATTYTGNGSTQSITNAAGFQPDLVWLKGRNAVSDNSLYDAIRGVTKELVSNTTTAEATVAQGLTSFNANGFSLGTAAWLNTNSNTYVGWQWKESVSAGFDIVTYTGNGSGAARAIAHSLGAAPKLIINKGRSAGTTGTDHWVVQHGAFNAGDYILLSATNAKANSSNYWGNTLPNSSNFYVGGGAANVGNENGIGYVAYLFAEVAGYSKFGSYTGNGSADGPFVFTNFQPRFVLVKRTDTSGYHWYMWDTSRNVYNVMDKTQYANDSTAEITASDLTIDAVANGFKLRGTSLGVNASGGTYIYAAFASNPFKSSLAR